MIPKTRIGSLTAILALVCVSFPTARAAAETGSRYAGSASSNPTQVFAAAPPPGALPGIDVSRHQGTIDWAQVAASGQRFVLAKATEGLLTVDPTYATNRAGAMAAGLEFGAYHFARPDLHLDNPSERPTISSTPPSSAPGTSFRSSTSSAPGTSPRPS